MSYSASVDFFYGLTFFLLGLVSIIISWFCKKKYIFFNKLIYFGIFALLKGITEWEHLFFPLYFYQLNIHSFTANLGHRLLLFISIFFLLLFSVELLVAYNKRLKLVRIIYPLSCIIFFTYFFIYPGNIFFKNIIKWSINIENTSRRYILLPAGLLAGYMTYLHANRLSEVKSIKFMLAVFGVLISIYSFLVGTFVFDINLIYTSYPNTFSHFSGIRLEYIEIFFALSMIAALLYSWSVYSREETRLNLNLHDVVLLDNERDRVARDLHDGVIQSLYGLFMQLSHMSHQIDLKDYVLVKDNIENVKSTLIQSVNDIRDYIYNKLSEEYKYENIEDGINHILEGLQKLIKIEFIYTNRNKTELRKDIVINVYFIIKEAVSNIIKHAQATKAIVMVKVTDDAIFITVKDNGVGFQQASLTGMGLASMSKRVYQYNGTIKIKHENGVSLHIEIPLGGL